MFERGGVLAEQISVPASTGKMDETLSWIDAHLDSAGFGKKPRSNVMLAAEEIFVNIANYAYTGSGGEGLVTIHFSMTESGAQIVFTDDGAPYDPLSRDDPDVTLTAEERKIGGLGIYLVKKMMDSVEYRYDDGKNILTIKKNLEAVES